MARKEIVEKSCCPQNVTVCSMNNKIRNLFELCKTNSTTGKMNGCASSSSREGWCTVSVGICLLKCSDVPSWTERELSPMALQRNLFAPSFGTGGGWGGAGSTGAELRCSFAEQPSQNLLNCSISGCSLSSSAYILSFGVPQSLKMCASLLQRAKKVKSV